MKKIKIIHAVMSLQNGGAEQVIYNYISNLSKNDYDFTILTHEPRNYEAEKKFNDLGIRIISIPKKGHGFIKYIYKCFCIFKSGNYDIIHVHMNYNSYYMLFAAILAGIKKRIVHSHSCIRSYGLKKIKEQLKKIFIYFFATDRISCGILASKYLFYKNDNPLILNNSIDVNRFQFNLDNRNLVRNNLGVSDNEILIGHIGRFMKVKNHAFIIELFNNLIKHNNCFKLLLIGDGEEKKKIIDLVNKYNLNQYIIFINSSSDIEKYYSAMDIFILPSLYEGVPMVGVEAQCNGLECIFSSNVSHEIKYNDNFYFIDLSDTNLWLNTILNYNFDKSKRSKTSKLFKNSNYNINNTVNILDNFYKKIYER